jgi:hypothetical protein
VDRIAILSEISAAPPIAALLCPVAAHCRIDFGPRGHCQPDARELLALWDAIFVVAGVTAFEADGVDAMAVIEVGDLLTQSVLVNR